MGKKDSKWSFLIKLILVVGFTTATMNAYASYRPVSYYGPDCNGYYRGSDCSIIVWVPCHWDPYGNYVEGAWVAVNR
ncbi:MAG: hypothetical protein H0W64_01530 [Gammaproteobacteria bacterium]|nr:hypothetical protein [Gammaproteobacteria bacterium]